MENRAARHFLRKLDRFRFGVFQQYMTNRINSGAFADEDLIVIKSFEKLTKRKTEVNAAPPKALNVVFNTEIDKIKSVKDDLVFATKALSASSSGPIGNGRGNSAAHEKESRNENVIKFFNPFISWFLANEKQLFAFEKSKRLS